MFVLKVELELAVQGSLVKNAHEAAPELDDHPLPALPWSQGHPHLAIGG